VLLVQDDYTIALHTVQIDCDVWLNTMD